MHTAEDFDRYVSVERGEVDRRIFSDPEIFELEQERIFGRAWLLLCHESLLKKPGDFFEAPMGRDDVLVVRQKDGTLRGLINSCAHRGNAVCRAEYGNTRNFMCTYHGWTYDLAGKLVGVPGKRQLFRDQLDTSARGLRPVAQLDSYKGFIFATHDPGAPPLRDFLGSAGRLGLDLVAEAGEMEVMPGIRKFIIDCNWKFAVDNVFDFYHAQVTHMSAYASGLFGSENIRPDLVVDAGGAATPDGATFDFSTLTGGGAIDSVVVLGEYGHAIGGPALSGGVTLMDQSWRQRPQAQEALGPAGMNVAGHPNIFPNAWITLNQELVIRIPRSPLSTEMWIFSFVDRSASPQAQEMQRFMANHIFGPAGFLEQEDGENFAQSSLRTTGHASRQIPQVLKMNLGRGKVIKEHGLARIDGTISEHAQLWTYASWAQWMKGSSWQELKANTIPGDYL